MIKSVQVIVTCYNHDRYIKQCLTSIFEQTYPHLSLAVYNDGSTDNSESMIEEALLNSPFQNTAYHYHENQGLVKTRNLALDTYLGQADYILFVDSDNYLQPNYIEAMVKRAEQGADIVYADLVNPDNGEQVIEARAFDLEAFYADNFIDSCSLIRQSIIKEARYDDYLNYKKLEDYEFFCQLIFEQGAVPQKCPETYLNYRVLPGAMSARHDLKKYYDTYFYILGKYFEKNPDMAQKALLSNYQRLYASLSPEIWDKEEQVTIYFSDDEHFIEQESLRFELKENDQIHFQIEDDVAFVRIDLSERQSYYKSIVLLDQATQTELEPISYTGISLGNHHFFNQPDPQLIYDVRHIAGRQLVLTYELFSLGQPESESFILNTLLEKSIVLPQLQQQQAIQEREIRLLTQERDEFRRQIEDLVLRYNSVTHSRRWTIPTAIINFFRRNK